MATAPTPEQIQYMLDNIDDDLTPSVHISSGITVAATTISVILRYFSRTKSGAGLGADDYCLFFGYVLYVVYMTALEVDTRWGFARHVVVVTNPHALAINTLICMTFYVFGMAFIKTSILLLYHRIFPTRKFRMALFGLGAVLFSWTMAAFFTSIFSCYPVASLWDPNVDGFCIDYGQVTLVIGIVNIAIDIAMLIYPMPILWGLQMSTRKKLLLSVAFTAGSIACVVSIARLFYARRTQSTYDSTWDNVFAGILSGLELCTAIVACCTVTYRPLFERIFGRGSKTKNSENGGTGSKVSMNRSLSRSANHTRPGPGWQKISVQHDISMVSNPAAVRDKDGNKKRRDGLGLCVRCGAADHWEEDCDVHMGSAYA
ncbi:hypothetical protein QBC35DRAFT_419821 [Podospora australis]|uniref:Rhodopsin domain-containing protein n=1 Tax=Podospora australis TaxID=1536484 RepID=A0AAN6WJ01_9PEZI|nr:hypothetical protein QBC35DRAFT_419821 [Podospora australis]